MKIRSEKRSKDLFSKVKSTVQQVRKQGDPPEEDLEKMENYICDLCKVSVGRSSITQCPFCGRWVCMSSCYSEEELCCRSCAGVIRLMRESIVLGELSEKEPEKKPEKDTGPKKRSKKRSK